MLTSPPAGPVGRDKIAEVLPELKRPADPAWMMARVAALLLPYYTSDVPHGVRMMEAEDWAEALAKYPEWAITKAVRWWKSAENERRRQKPVEGDIAARADLEMAVVRLAERAVARFDAGERPKEQTEPPPERQRVDPARANAILQAAGFAPKRFGGDA